MKHSVLLIVFLSVSMAVFAQPENKITGAEKSLQQLLNWRIVGPFTDTLKDGTASVHLKFVTQQAATTLTDTIYHQSKDYIDLEVLLKTNATVIGYASCKVFSDRDQEMVLFINADDRLRLWVNDSLAVTVPTFTRNEAFVSNVFLRKGYNIFLAEINNTGGGNWGFDIDITTSENAQHITKAFLSAIPKNSIIKTDQSKIQLKNWKITGPFSHTIGEIEESRLGYLKYIPQNATHTIIDTLYQQGKDGTDLGTLLNTDMRGIAYAICDVVAEEDQELAFLVNADDEMRLWKNDSTLLLISGYTSWGAVIKKLSIKKGTNRLIAEIRNTGGGPWWFDINTCSYEYIRDNGMLPGVYYSARNFIITGGDSLYLDVADTDIVPVKNISTVKVYDTRNRNCYTGHIDIKKNNKFPLPALAPGAYRYELYTDKDTLTEYFCYGPINKIYNREKLIQKYEHNKKVHPLLVPYIKRLDRLLGDFNKSPNATLEKKIVYCIYKVIEIDSAYQHKSQDDLNSTGLSLRMFTSTIEHGEEHYLLYVPGKLKKGKEAFPLAVIVPYVTNNHPFYTGGIVANTDRVTYISKFAEKYGMAVIWPSSRIFRWYNQTPIVTKAIEESIGDVCKNYNIDKKHIFLYGECSGGLFALQTAIRRPDLFAAIAIEGPELGSVENAETEASGMLTNDLFSLTENLYGKPFLVLHSGNDQKAPVYHSLRLIDSVKNTGWKVDYDDLNNLTRGTFSKLYSEPESMNKAFAFFNAHKNSKPLDEKKIATYGFYNDTVYGIWVKEKIAPGKATVSYKIEMNRLVLTTNNVRKLIVDTRKMDIKSSKKIKIDLNGTRLVKGTDFKTQGPVIELTNHNNNGFHFTKEVHGPVNKVFLNTFAVVRPTQANEKVKSAISVIDSLWVDEYRNHVQIIDERQVDSAKKRGVNLIYFITDIHKIEKPLLSIAAIELKNDSLICNSENYGTKASSFVFYFKDTNGTDNIYLGINSPDTPSEMLKAVFIRKGWYDFEMWDSNYPILQHNYGMNE